MNKTDAEAGLETCAEFFKALSHPSRLLILKLMRIKPRHGEELAAILQLNPATISHHLAILTGAGLLVAHKDQYYQTYSLDEGALDQTVSQLLAFDADKGVPGAKEDAYKEKVIRTFFKRGRLVSIPVQLKKQQIVLEKIAEQFEPDREYTEKEVSIILLDFHDDVASLRRGLVDQGLMSRAGGLYQRKKS
jgi:ArsR family transcriptional regulator